MRVCRQLIWLCLGALLCGCLPIDPTPAVFDRSPFSRATQAEGNAHCTDLYAVKAYAPLSGLMPIQPGELPSQDMFEITTAPSPEQVSAIKALESATHQCRLKRKAAGIPTSASEDILAQRTSQLRYGLYKGDIPFAVYNYGLAQALRRHNAFLIEGEQAEIKGREAGQVAQVLGQFAILSSLLGGFDQGAGQQAQWTCAPSTTSGGAVNCY